MPEDSLYDVRPWCFTYQTSYGLDTSYTIFAQTIVAQMIMTFFDDAVYNRFEPIDLRLL